MTSESLISLSATVERGLVAAAVTLGLGLGAARAWRRADASAPGIDETMNRHTEFVLLAVIVAYGTFVRVVGWNDQLTPVFFFSEVPQLHVAKFLDAGTFWATWVRLLHSYKGIWTQDSAVVLPVLGLLQRILGPSFGLPVLLGAVFAVPSIVLAWLLGRALRTPVFGLLFSAFVACSALQVTWSRLGGLYIAAAPHVLLALLCGWVAGRRRSVLLTLATGVVGWASLYNHYSARVAIPLAGVALLRGGHDAGASWRCRSALIGVFIITLGVVFYAFESGGWRQTLWPTYAGYVGNRGEQSLTELLAYVHTQGREALERYFLRGRTTMAGAGQWDWGIGQGGLCLEPLAVLGAIGLLTSAWNLRRDFLWLLMLAAGLAIPSLAVPSARRFIVMDLAWCALAAHGLLALVSTLGRGASRRTTALLAGGLTGAIAVWSATAIFALGDALPRGAVQPIPFGEDGFGDGTTCRRCSEAGREWERDISTGAFVVLFDSDLYRENATSPGGLPTYGKLAALAVSAPKRFIDGYALMLNSDRVLPSLESFYDNARTNFADFLRERMEQSAPARIVWQFERPTPWEHWLAGRLVAAGGEESRFSTPLAAGPEKMGIRVVTPWAQRNAAFAVVRELARGTGPERESACIGLVDLGVVDAPNAATLVAGSPTDGRTGPPTWLVGGFDKVGFGAARFEVISPIGVAVDLAAGGGASLDVIGADGQRTLIDVPSGERRQQPLRLGIGRGVDCAKRVGKDWWGVEPISGRLFTTRPDADWVPRAPWMGIARGPTDELILASADQTIVVLDVENRREIARFPATVSPSRRVDTDECAQVAAGPGWIATLNNLDSNLSVYDPQGRPLGTRRLDAATKLSGWQFSGLGSAGRYLGLGIWAQVKTLEITIDQACVVAPPAG